MPNMILNGRIIGTMSFGFELPELQFTSSHRCHSLKTLLSLCTFTRRSLVLGPEYEMALPAEGLRKSQD